MPSPSAAGSAGDSLPPSRAPRVGFWLYAGHLWSGFAIALSNAALGILFLSLPWTGRDVRGAVRRALPLLALSTLYLLLLAASILFSSQPATSASAFSGVFNLLTLILGVLLVRGEKDVRRIVDGLLVLGGILAVAGLVQFFDGYGGLDHRIRGPFSHYMTFAGYLLVVDMMLLASLVTGRRWRSAWRWLALAAINVALLGSLTRSAWVGLGAALTLLLSLTRRRLLLAYLPAGILLVLLAPIPLLERFGSIVDLADRSNYDRLCMAYAGLQMIEQRPFVGLGPNLVERRYPIYRSEGAPRYQVPHLHNTFLQLGAERGLPTLATYLVMVASAMGLAWRRYRHEGGPAGPRADLYLGVLCALLAFNVAGLFENNWGDTEVQRLVLFVMALPFCLEATEGGAEVA